MYENLQALLPLKTPQNTLQKPPKNPPKILQTLPKIPPNVVQKYRLNIQIIVFSVRRRYYNGLSMLRCNIIFASQQLATRL